MSADHGIANAARLDSLTGLRWWAAFAVFLHHMTNLAPLPIHAGLALGTYGVMFFFVLSGFVLTWSVTARPVSVSTFYWRRFARIYPAHLVALAIAIPVFYSAMPLPEQTWVKPLDISVLLLSLVLLQGWVREPTVLFSGNPAAWTLTCEAFFYALHPLLSRPLRALGSSTALAIAAAIFLIPALIRGVALAVPDLPTVLLPLPVARLGEFAIGMCLAHAMRRGWIPKARTALVMAGSGLIVSVLAIARGTDWLGSFGGLLASGTTELMLIVCVALIVSVASRDMVGGRSLLRHPLLVKLGEASYAFYLVHATLMYAVLAVVGRQYSAGAVLWYPVMLVGSLICAFLLHRLVERPGERHLREWWDRRRSARARGSADAVYR